MNRVLCVSALMVLVAAFSAHADTLVRIKCQDIDVGAEVYINNEFVGTCPLDVAVKPGAVHLRARKNAGGQEELFAEDLVAVDGVPQRVELIMSSSQAPPEVKQSPEEMEAAIQLRAAEGGSIEAMKKISQYYYAGKGVAKDFAQSAYWRNKAEAAIAQEQLRAAKAGDTEAMENIAARYETGRGVDKNLSQANYWRTKIEKINGFSFFRNTKYFTHLNFDEPGDFVLYAVSCLTFPVGVPSLLLDIVEAPSRTSELAKLKNEAAFHPSTWGKPDSMIARAARQTKAEGLDN